MTLTIWFLSVIYKKIDYLPMKWNLSDRMRLVRMFIIFSFHSISINTNLNFNQPFFGKKRFSWIWENSMRFAWIFMSSTIFWEKNVFQKFGRNSEEQYEIYVNVYELIPYSLPFYFNQLELKLYSTVAKKQKTFFSFFSIVFIIKNSTLVFVY